MRAVLFLIVSALFIAAAALLVRKGNLGLTTSPSETNYRRFLVGIVVGTAIGLVPLVMLREPGPSILMFLLAIAVGGTIGALFQTRR